MNSLNILSSLSTSPASPARALSQDHSEAADRTTSELTVGSAYDAQTLPLLTQEPGDMARVEAHSTSVMQHHHPNNETHMYDEKSPLLGQQPGDEVKPVMSYTTWMLTRQIPGSIAGAVRMVLAAILAPGRYLIACFYNDEGQFSPMMPCYRIARAWAGTSPKPEPPVISAMEYPEKPPLPRTVSSAKLARSKKYSRRQSSTASNSALTSDSELDSERPSSRDEDRDSPALHTRSRTASAAPDEIAPSKRSIRIKLHSDEALQERKRKSQARKKSPVTTASNPESLSPEEAAAALKSPTSPATSSKMTKFPRAPLPPRPLVPRRQPSYTTSAAAVGPHQKTLIIDLDETLIHSQVKGGRFTTGHMVEVKLQQPIGMGGVTLGPSVPILYYVNKRPHCDEFLRKVSKWYNLVIFTASMQEYADPVIDWLEAEFKYFSARYYRQHCTARGTTFIKDLSQVEPDLSKVMILDNSPICYAFHPDNAIPIDGWTSDPTDNDLLYLVPFLEGLQYVTDVRALLGLRLGQPEAV